MIVKMKFLSITGPKEDIGRVTEKYLSKYEIHLENALSELKDVKNLMPYIQINPYKEKLKMAEDYTAMLPEKSRSAAGKSYPVCRGDRPHAFSVPGRTVTAGEPQKPVPGAAGED